MTSDQVHHLLESGEQARAVLLGWKLQDWERGRRNLQHLAQGLGSNYLTELLHPLSRLLPRCPEPDMALNNLERFLAHPAGRQQLPTLLEARARTLETLLQLFSTSQFFSDLLAVHPEFLEMVRIPLRYSPSRAEMLQQLQGEVDAAFEDASVLRAFRRFRQKHLLRIGTNDIIRDRPLEEITRDISRVADTVLEVALTVALRQITNRFGEPWTSSHQPARVVALAFGKHGGKELNYSSDIDLMFLYDEEGGTRGKRSSIGNDEFFGRVVTEVVRLLTIHTDWGQAYRVDLRLRPEGQRGPLARSLASTLSYYDTLGRTWERQALIKVRPVAGNLRLGEDFVKTIEPFVYRKYLSFAEINEIKALKRRIEQKTRQAGETDTEVKTGHGGIRDVEFTIQFLQLLNGGDLPEVRQRNTLKAMQALEEVGCLTDQEYQILDSTYRFLRKVEHRLQLMFDAQTHRLPERPEELYRLALRMGYSGESTAETVERREDFTEEAKSEPGDIGDGSSDSSSPPLLSAASVTTAVKASPLDAFLTDYRQKTDLNRSILNHLLHDVFSGDRAEASPETDLILDPDPDEQTIEDVLGRYPFRDRRTAYHNLMLLATEPIRFLSTRRCRQFLASIAPLLLRALAETPDPDMALINLEKVSASLGGKAVLWELFSFSEPALKLYVDLCASSQFLSEILINNPGMVDELLDSLILNQPRTAAELHQELAELFRGAEDIEPILHSFQDKELLRIGVRDILGKDSVQATTHALSDLAEAILNQIAHRQMPHLLRRYGVPYLGDGNSASGSPVPARYVLLGLGKLGGYEMSYQSDLDLILIYEGDGRTGPPVGASRFARFELTDNFFFFAQLAQHIIKATSYLGPRGRLYQVDMRLRPTGKSGSLATPLQEFERYHKGGGAQLWERQALTRARVVHGDPEFGQQVMRVLAQVAYEPPWKPEIADEIFAMRERMQAGSRNSPATSGGGGRDLKRGKGGIVDVEFLVQLFRLKYGRDLLALRTPNTWEALAALRAANLLSVEEQQALHSSYDFLRLIESRLRIVHNLSLDELPGKQEDLEKLARRLGLEGSAQQSASAQLLAQLNTHLERTRELFVAIGQRER